MLAKLNCQVYNIREELEDEDVRIVLVGKSLGGLLSVSCCLVFNDIEVRLSCTNSDFTQ